MQDIDSVVPQPRRGYHTYTPGAMSLVAAAAAIVATLVGAASPSFASTTRYPAAAVDVKVATVPKYGKILVNASGLPLYYDTANKPGKWACTGDCLTAWPPLLVPKGQKSAIGGPGVTGLGTVKGPSGLQVTWEGKALYTFFEDSKGVVKGQGIKHVWYVAQLTATTTAAATSSWG